MKKKEVYKLEEIFTPSQPAVYTFIERHSVNRILNRALRTPGKQIIIFGYSGAGKTTVLTNVLREKKIKSITTRCVTGMTLNDIVIDAFNQLEVYYHEKFEANNKGKVGGLLSASYFGLKASLTAEKSEGLKTSSRRAVELPITPQTLAKFIGPSGNCWILEDFHNIENKEKVLMTQIMKVFMDSSIEFPTIKLIAVGAVNSAREVVQFNPEMKNRISEIEIPLMKNSDLQSIIYTGQKLLNISISDKITSRIVAYSSGLPAVTHQLSYLLCEVNRIERTHKSIKAYKIPLISFDDALNEYLNENSDTLKSIYEHSTRIINKRKSENPANILKAIITTNKESVTINDIIEIIQISDKNYKGNNIKKYVDELTLPIRSEILRYNKESMTYFFSNPFIKAYFQCVLRNDINNKVTNTNILLGEFRNTLNKELEIARRIFIKDYEEFDDFEDNMIDESSKYK